jgi:type III pantothenate kinase
MNYELFCTFAVVNLIIDIGNTCAKMVCFDKNKVVEEQRVDKGEEHLLDEFCKKYSFERGIVSAVAELSAEFTEKIHFLPFPVLFFESGVTPIPITNKYRTPETLGTDRLAAAVGAATLNPGRDILIIDVGTCITYDFVNSRGEYLGGNISPGPTIRFKALNKFTARLPFVDREGANPLLGDTTITAIRSGVIRGVKYEIEGYIRRFSEKYPNLYIYLTGGVHLGLHFSKNFPNFAPQTDDYLVPKGLNRILQYNEKNI